MQIKKELEDVACALLLAGCAKEVSYADFHKAATEVEKHQFTLATATMKGTIKDDGEETKVDYTCELAYTVTLGVSAWAPKNTADITNKKALLLATFANMTAADVQEESDTKYYAGSTFKVVSENGTANFNKFGLITSMNSKEDGSDYKVTFKWSK